MVFGELIQIHLVRFHVNLSLIGPVVVVSCRDSPRSIELGLILLVLLLSLFFKLFQTLQSLIHVHVLRCGILRRLVEGTEILLRATEMLHLLLLQYIHLVVVVVTTHTSLVV